ncbi:MAG: hypothetical protein K2N80_05095 [Lachnospiraceae bacterium]|nr:hypothetical protein [Lachnospiraceae bacterium]
MYYRKYFEGGPITSSETVKVTFGACSAQYNVLIEQSRIIGHAVEEVLCDAGMNAYYDDEHFILYPNREEKLGIGIFKQALGTISYVVFACDDIANVFNTSSSSGGSGYQPFNVTTGADYGKYKFYITVIGEPKGWLRVHVGTYNNPANMSYGFGIGYGKDIRDNRRVGYFVINPGYNTTSFYVRRTDDGSLVDGIAYSETVKFSAAAVTGQTNTLVLINIYDTHGYLTMDNCYLGCSALTAGTNNFYIINGVEYYYPNVNMLIKCISKVSVTG